MKKFIAILLVIVALVLVAAQYTKFFPDIILTYKDGPWWDTRMYADFTDVLTAMSVETKPNTVYIVREETYDNDGTIPSTSEIVFRGRGSITQTAGTLKVWASSIRAPERTVFSTTGAGSFDFADGAVVHSSWFDNFDDAVDVTDNDVVTMLVDGWENVTSSDALGDDVVLRFDNVGDFLYLQTGVVLSNVSSLEAGRFQVLRGPGRLDFNDGSELHTSWFERFDEAVRFADDSLIKLTVDRVETLVANTVVPTGVTLDWQSGNVMTLEATLAIGGAIDAGWYKIFNPSSTYLPTFPGATRVVRSEWWGARADGTTDNTTFINLALDSMYAGGKVELGLGTYRCDSPIRLRQYASLVGQGWLVTVIDSRASTYSFYSDEKNTYNEYSGFKVTHENNSNSNVDFMVFKGGINLGNFDLEFYGKAGNSRHGLVIHGRNPDTLVANQNSYGSRVNIYAHAAPTTEVTGTAIYLYGEDVGNARCNAHRVSGWIQHWSNAVFVNGNGNLFSGLVFNGVHSDKALHIEGDQAFVNEVVGCYFDGSITGDKIYLNNTAGANIVYMVKCDGNIGINDPANDIVDGTAAPDTANYWVEDYRGGTLPLTGSLSVDPDSNVFIGYRGQNPDGVFGLAGSRSLISGRLLLASHSFSTAATYLGKEGSASIIFHDDVDADFRVVKYDDGTTTYTRLVTVNNSGDLSVRIGFLNVYSDEMETISGGVITATKSFVAVEGEGATDDDLVTINGAEEGDILFVRAYDTTHTITAKHGTGNLWLPGQTDCVLDNSSDLLALMYTGASWMGIACADNRP